MERSSLPGIQPSVSNRLADYLCADTDELADVPGDEFDRLLAADGLRINRFVFFRDLDLFLIILTNRRTISRRISAYSFLQNATDQQLTDYILSANSIRWPALDADLSLGAVDVAPDVRVTEYTTSVDVVGLSSPWLPVAFPAVSVDGLEGAWNALPYNRTA